MKGKKLLSAILAGAMVLGTMSLPAFAAETEVDSYEALTAAITQANSGDTIKLSSDITISDTYTISNANPITIDFNGRNIDVTGVSVDNASIVVAGGADVTFMNSTGEGGIKGYKNCLTNEGGTITLSGGTYTTQNDGRGTALFNGSGSMTINDGVKVNALNFAVYNDVGASCDIKGGEIISRSHNGRTSFFYCVKNAGTMNIYDGAVIKGIQGAFAPSGEGTTTIYGGTFETFEEEDSDGKSFYACYAANKAKVVIYDGTFIAARRQALFVGNEDSGKDEASVQIKGGKFISNGGSSSAAIQANIVGELEISGGTFSSDVSAHVANGYYCKKNADETYSVEESPIIVGETYYTTLADALSAAQNGDTIKVLSDITLTNNILMTDDKAVTLDLNGKTLSCEGGRIFLSGTDMTVTGNGFIKADLAKGSQSAIEVQNIASKLTIDSVNVNAGANNIIFVVNGGEIVINGGTFTAENGGTVILALGESSKVTVNDGTFIGKDGAEYTYHGTGAVWGANGANVNVYGGEFDIADDYSDPGINYTFFDYRGFVGGYVSNISTHVNSKANINVFGGTYNVNPAAINAYLINNPWTTGKVDYVAPGYVSTKKDGKYTVGKSEAKIIDTAKTTGAEVTLDNLTKNSAIDHEPDATYKVVVSTAPVADADAVNQAIEDSKKPESTVTPDNNKEKAIFDISVVKVDSNGVTTDLGGTTGITDQQVTLTLGDTPAVGSTVYVYHVKDDGTVEQVAAIPADGTNKVTFTAPSFSTYAVTYNVDPSVPVPITDEIGVVFSPVSAGSNQYYITLKALEAGKKINRFMSADIAFKNECASVDYEIAPAANMTAAVIGENGTTREYRFEMNGRVASSASSELNGGITIGTITFGGYGTLNFSVDTAYTAGHAVNIVNTAIAGTNIVENYMVGGTKKLVVNDSIVSGTGNVAADETGKIGDELKLATKKLTVNVEFNNAISDNAKAYQKMWAVISGGDLTSDITVNFGSDEVALSGDMYTFEKNLTQNVSYMVTVYGEGYRTARYTVTMTSDKTLNFWNDVKLVDDEKPIEVGSSDKRTKNFLAGDIVKDNDINLYDLSAVVSYFGEGDTDTASLKHLATAHPEYAKYDLNRDGVIDSKDVAYVLVSWGN